MEECRFYGFQNDDGGVLKKKEPPFYCYLIKHILSLRKIENLLTKLHDLTVYINGKSINILHSQMEVYIDWDLSIEKHIDYAEIKYLFYRAEGIFYAITSEYKFSTDENWKFFHIPFCADYIIPTSAIINFDDKTVKIKF